MSSRVRGDLKLEAHERRETRQVSPAHHPICRSHSEFMFQSMWISRYVCKLLDGRGGDSESRETNLTIGFPVVFPPRSVAHVRATENLRPAVLGCKRNAYRPVETRGQRRCQGRALNPVASNRWSGEVTFIYSLIVSHALPDSS